MTIPSRVQGSVLPLSIEVADMAWYRLVPDVERVVRRAALAAGVARLGPTNVLLASDRAVRGLNARHRGRNRATNVLTFPSAAGAFADATGGDIVLAAGVVAREARAARLPARAHLAHLVVHGVLHLDGHDHGAAGEAARMERMEARLLARLGVANPWKPRAARVAGQVAGHVAARVAA